MSTVTTSVMRVVAVRMVDVIMRMMVVVVTVGRVVLLVLLQLQLLQWRRNDVAEEGRPLTYQLLHNIITIPGSVLCL